MTYYSRNLPHWHPEGRTIFLTWRLFGSLPRTFARNLEHTPGKQFVAADRVLDQAATGPRWLHDSTIAACVISAINRGTELGFFILHAFVVMPNHVHILLDPQIPIPRITKGIKLTSAISANTLLSRTGSPFWQDESFDHWIRNSSQFERIKSYIELNPVKAGLVAKPEDWPWSSASSGTGILPVRPRPF
jgi:putative transposase